MYCPSCGREIPDGSKFCPYCGFKIEEERINITQKVKGRSKPKGVKDSILSFPLYFIGSILLGGIPGFVAFYRLVGRRNNHFRRTRDFWREVIAQLRSKEVQEKQIRAMEQILRDGEPEEMPRSPGGLLLGTIFTGGILGLYVYYFLNRDFVNHAEREQRLMDMLREILSAQKIDVSLPQKSLLIPKRNLFLREISGSTFS